MRQETKMESTTHQRTDRTNRTQLHDVMRGKFFSRVRGNKELQKRHLPCIAFLRSSFAAVSVDSETYRCATPLSHSFAEPNLVPSGVSAFVELKRRKVV